MATCKGIKNDGTRCGRKVVNGEYCRDHRFKEIEKSIKNIKIQLTELEGRLEKLTDNIESIQNYLKSSEKKSRKELEFLEIANSINEKHLFAGRVSVLTAIAVGFMIFLQYDLMNTQTKHIEKQTDLFAKQDTLFSNQNTLLEAEVRRSNMTAVFSSVMEAIEVEIDEKKNRETELSDFLTERIIQLSRNLLPYRHALAKKKDSISPLRSFERGHLLMNLLAANLDTNTYKQIFKYGDFRFSKLGNQSFDGKFLKGINLRESDLSHSSFCDAKLDNAIFADAILYKSTFQKENFEKIIWDTIKMKNDINSLLYKDSIMFCIKTEMQDKNVIEVSEQSKPCMFKTHLIEIKSIEGASNTAVNFRLIEKDGTDKNSN